MRLFFKKLFCLTATLLFAIAVKAQKDDYVLLEKGDTIKTPIKTPLIGKANYVNGEGVSVKIDPKEVKEYYISEKNEIQRSVSINGKKKQFLRVEETGILNLYERVVYIYTTYGSSTQVTWFISKNSGPLEEIKFNSLIAFNKQKRKELLGDMLADNKQAYDKYTAMDKKFTFKQIKSLVHLYNTGVWNGD